MSESAERANDQAINQEQRCRDFLVQSAKAVLILNAGAIIAVIGLLQSMIEHGFAVGFKAFAVLSSLAFLFGAISSIWVTWSSYEYADQASKSHASGLTGAFASLASPEGKGSGRAYRGAFYVSVIAFAIGVSIAILGVLCVIR